MVEIINRQRRRRINNAQWREFTDRALLAINTRRRDVTIVFVSDRAIRKLNHRFRNNNRATDVLSFPANTDAFEDKANLGDVVVSLERAEAQARVAKLTFNREVQQLILHGLLHLCGYDHETDEGQMDRLEMRLRSRLSIDR